MLEFSHKMFTSSQIQDETTRLHERLERVGFGQGYCHMIAPLTLEIAELKRQKNAIILAHSYQTPDILYGIADFMGDSYQLSKKAQETDDELIIFCGVKFMAETAKILNPTKKVLLPNSNAGCSLADSITGSDVRKLKSEHPGIPVVSYVNTSAEVKAESDACCTSANALQIIESFPSNEIIFLPDELMAKNVQAMTDKKLITWKGRCIVHEDFKAETVRRFKKIHPGLQVLAHSECAPEVTVEANYTGGTEGMMRYVAKTEAPAYMLITECGLADRMRIESPNKEFLGMCGLCPFMKMNTLPNILQVLREPKPEQIVDVPEDVRVRAERALLKMFELTATNS